MIQSSLIQLLCFYIVLGELKSGFLVPKLIGGVDVFSKFRCSWRYIRKTVSLGFWQRVFNSTGSKTTPYFAAGAFQKLVIYISKLEPMLTRHVDTLQQHRRIIYKKTLLLHAAGWPLAHLVNKHVIFREPRKRLTGPYRRQQAPMRFTGFLLLAAGSSVNNSIIHSNPRPSFNSVDPGQRMHTNRNITSVLSHLIEQSLI